MSVVITWSPMTAASSPMRCENNSRTRATSSFSFIACAPERWDAAAVRIRDAPSAAHSARDGLLVGEVTVGCYKKHCTMRRSTAVWNGSKCN